MATNAAFINSTRGLVSTFLITLEQMDSLRKEFAALDLGTVLVDDDFIDPSPDVDITKLEFTDAIDSIIFIVDALEGSGHDTNLYRMKR